MSNVIHVSLTAEDKFKLTNPDNGRFKMIKSSILHDPLYVTKTSIEALFLSKFKGFKTLCEYSEDALTRINSIVDFNSIDDRW